MPIRYRVTRLTLTAGDGGDGDPLPVADWRSATSVIPEGEVIAVELSLDKAAKDPVTVPFTPGGTGVYKTDYQFRQGPTTDDPVFDRPIVTIPAGNSSGLLYIEGLAVAANVTFTLTLAESVDWPNGETYTLTNATLGTTTQVHTGTVVDSGTLTASFTSAASVVTEADATVVHSVEVTLSDASPGGVTVDVDSTGGGTAVAGTDFDWPAGPPVTLTFAATERTKTVDFDILDTPTDEDDETLVIDLSNYVGCSAGVITEHTVTIRDDEVDTPTGEITLVDGDAVSIAEGGTLAIPVIYTGGKAHAPLKITDFTVLGTEDGPNGVSADEEPAKPFRVLTPLPLVIDDGTDRADILIENTPDNLNTGPRDLQVKLVSLLVPVGVTFGDYKNKYVTLLDDDVDVPKGDGDLTDIDGTRICPERRQFDYTAPDLICRKPGDVGGLTGSESVEVASARAATALNTALGTSYSAGDVVSAATGAMLLAGGWTEHIWTHLHVPTYANSGAVPIGTELEEVLVECKSDTWNSQYLACDTAFLPAQSGGGQRIAFWDGSGSIRWTGSGNTVIRDVIFYTRPSTPPTCARMRGFFIGSRNGQVDNLRWDRIHFRKHDNNNSICQVDAQFNGNGTVGDFKMQGRIKVYDCQFDGDADNYTTGGGEGDGPTRCIQAGPAAWDVRHPAAGMPWPAFWPSWEHICYLRCVVGTTTYAALGTDPADGTYTRASNVFLNIITAERQPGHHPDATFNGATGQYEGPGMSSKNTVFQLVNRPNYNKDADMSSGLLAFIRCRAVGFGGAAVQTDRGDAFKVHGHNGDILFRDCSVEPHFETGKCGGGIKIEQDGPGTTNEGPQGKWDLEQEAGRFYSATKLRIEGFRGVVGGHSNSLINIGTGVEDVDVRKFEAVGWDSEVFSLGSVSEVPGTMYIRYFRVDNLVDPDDETSAHTGTFSTYPGFGNASPQITDSYHANWRADNDNVRTLTSDDVDNLPTEGPAGYTQTNGIIDQQYANRLQGTWASGTGKVDRLDGVPNWASSGYDSNTQPNKPKAEHTDSAEHFQGEGESTVFYVDFDGRCQSKVQVRFTLSGDTGDATLEAAAQTTWPTVPTWATATSPHTIEPIAGAQAASGGFPRGGDQGDAVPTGFQINPHNTVWDDDYEEAAFRFVPDAGLSTGTRTITMLLQDGGVDSDFETYPGSTVYETCDVSGTQTRDFSIVPVVDYPEVSFATSLVIVTDATAGASVQVVRVTGANGNADGIQLTSATTFVETGRPLGSTFTYDLTATVTHSPGDGDGAGTAQYLTISNIQGAIAGEFVTIGLDTVTNGVKGVGQTVTFNFLFT